MTWDFQGRNGTSKAGTGRLGGNMYHRRWELAGRETGRGSYHRRWDGGNWQVGRWEEEFSTGDGIEGGNWQAGRREEEFTAGDGTSKGDEFTT